MYWGANPFTNYSTQPYGMSPNSGSQGMGGWGGPTTAFGGMGGMGSPSMPSMFQGPMWGGGNPMNMWQPGQPGLGGLGGWGGGFGNSGFGGGMSPWMGAQGAQDYSSLVQQLQRLMQGGMGGQMGYGNQFNQTKPLQIPGTPGPQVDPGIGTGGSAANTFNAGAPSAPNGGLYANVIHNSTFDGALDPNNMPLWAQQASRNGY